MILECLPLRCASVESVKQRPETLRCECSPEAGVGSVTSTVTL